MVIWYACSKPSLSVGGPMSEPQLVTPSHSHWNGDPYQSPDLQVQIPLTAGYMQ
jgi:hypothetical protein